MKEIVIIGGMAAIFFFGYVFMGKLDWFLKHMRAGGREVQRRTESGRTGKRVV